MNPEFVDTLEELIDPHGIIGSVSGSTLGMYGTRGWCRELGMKIAKSTTAQVQENLLAYVACELPAIDTAAGTAAASAVSHCVGGMTGKAATLRSLYGSEYFKKLDAVHATLEFLAGWEQMSAEDVARIVRRDYEAARYSLICELQKKEIPADDLSEEVILGYVVQKLAGGGKLTRLRMEYNKQRSLFEHCEAAYGKATELLNS